MIYLLIPLLFVLTSACGQQDTSDVPGDVIHARILVLNRSGEAQHKRSNKQKALYYHNLALQMAKKHGRHEDQIRSLIGIARVLKADDADQSVYHLKKALHLADSIGHKQLSSEIYHSLSEIYRQQENYKQALQALEEHHRLADKLMQEDKNHKIALLQKTYQRDGILIIAVAILLILLILLYDFKKIQKLNIRLQASNQIKDKLFTIIGHDLRNPIGSITNVLGLMEQDELTADEQREMISLMRKQGDISLEILNSLLSWGQAQLNGITVKPVVFQAATVIENNIAAVQGKAFEKSLKIKNHVGSDIWVTTDKDHFDFILRNLLSNAIKFSHNHGEIEIAASTIIKPNHIVFSVKDYGLGISAVQQEIFLARQMDITFGTHGEKGTGIGLMLIKEFQKANGGSIWLESEEGKGTTFHISYPIN
ncbi:ATP-binding protein [Pedobacter sp. AW31-3R]|uniref:ATP-binding protein n=1 Tax=Pedobacter sp. AW31-3R TaxID=3445781 RepID=UPI003F9EC699